MRKRNKWYGFGQVGRSWGRKHCNQNALYKRNVFLTKKKKKPKK